MNRPPFAPAKRYPTYQRHFEVIVDRTTDSGLAYFVNQELAYYNLPNDFLSFRDKERKLWETCAEHAVTAEELAGHPADEWPQHLRPAASLVFEQDGSCRLSPAHMAIMNIAAQPARLHPLVRRNMAAEVLKSMMSHAESLASALKTDRLKGPVQMMVSHGLESKRHLQIPQSLVKITYDADAAQSLVSIPYAKSPLVVRNHNLSEARFNMMIIRSSTAYQVSDRRWFIELKEGDTRYMIGLTDQFERRKR